MTIPTNLDLPAEGFVALDEETTVPEETAVASERLPFLRIVADYPVYGGAGDPNPGMPVRVCMELNLGDVDETEERTADIHEVPSSGFIRLVTDTIGALRYASEPPLITIVNNGGISPEQLKAMADRSAVLDRYGRKPEHHEHVVATVFGRPFHGPCCGGTACGPDGDPVCVKCGAPEGADAGLGGVTGLDPDTASCVDQEACAARTAAQDAGDAAPIDPPPVDPADAGPELAMAGHEGSDRWTGGDRKDAK